MRVPPPVALLASLLIATAAHALPNAPNYDITPTYDLSGQVVHPDVVHIPGKLNGYAYWMAITPYPNGVDAYENPSILASNDGRNWTVPAGLTNPLVPQPGTNYNNDPDLLYVNGTLVLYFNETERNPGNETRVKRMTSTNGVNWSAPQTVITATNYPLSPAIIYSSGTYTMWYVYTQEGCGTTPVEVLRKRTSNDGITWGAPTPVTLNSAVRPWHVDVVKDGTKYKMLYVGYSSCANFSLYYAESDDGDTWTANPTPVLTHTTGWDSKHIYRASFLASGNAMRVWYSAMSTGGQWHLGYTETTLLTNATTYDPTPTYDGSGQTNHPDVVHVPGGWNGYAYWMANTPYTNGNNQVENPSILVSQDGRTWSVPPGLTNPLVPPPPGGGLNHNNDPDLLLVGNTLVLYFNQTLASGVTNLRRMTSTNGVNWSAPQTVLTSTNYPLSPAVVYRNGQYTMWSVYTAIACGSGTEIIQRRTSTNGIAWSTPTTVALNGSPAVPWHLNVVFDGTRYRMLYVGYLTGDDCSSMRLYYAESADGLTWTATPTPVIAPIGQNWDRRLTYRASLLNVGDQLQVWYAGADPAFAWHTGYTTGCIGDCTPPATTTNLAVATSRNAATLTWTAPGDDGSVGTATVYDLRYSIAPINEGSFGSATPIPTMPPNPAGTFETACIDGLTQCSLHFFALKTQDDRGNWSALSNVVAKSTKCSGPFWLCELGLRARVANEIEGDFQLAFELPQPNPATSRVTFAFSIPATQSGTPVELSVFDIAGRKLRTLVSAAAAGRTERVWDLRTTGGELVPPGTYFARLHVGRELITRTVVITP